MRILSDFKDYYDFVQQHDRDHSLQFLRFQKELPLKEYPFPHLKWIDNNGFIDVTEFMVGFCGKLYPGFKLETDPDRGGPRRTQYCYSLAEIDEFIAENRSQRFFDIYSAANPEKAKKNNSDVWFLDIFRKAYQAVFEAASKMEIQDFFLAHNLVIFKSEPGCYTGPLNKLCRRTRQVIINPRLKDIEFYRLFPTAQAYQEISMYLGSVAAPQRPIPPVSDRDMITAKGFDKWSFRQEGPKKRKVKA